MIQVRRQDSRKERFFSLIESPSPPTKTKSNKRSLFIGLFVTVCGRMCIYGKNERTSTDYMGLI
jgi:hypothetical protein